MLKEPMPMDLRRCTIEGCFHARRYFRSEEGSTVDIYRCKCMELSLWDGTSVEVILPVVSLLESVKNSGEFYVEKMGICVDK